MAASHALLWISKTSGISSLAISFVTFILLVVMTSAQLSANFYASSCPNVLTTIRTAVNSAVSKEARMGASLLRLHFHDCFVNASELHLARFSFLNFSDVDLFSSLLPRHT